ncbi:elongation factor P lysine(34) lysyltransferase [Aliidiomarina minuta]|uniref:Elongation factor P lysine(34) lysyltransferase n=1 Tax=Aliidiomarina minuta TaxID=880057 RepID=A0A432W441_9GAMM|nr:elongation factor P--(R)-beta-lysine ligase [Aliidiomarina minuta]RUO24108.1 elongation factor P lysine(34) lysyltransferase [Aliidiomarina minuta]
MTDWKPSADIAMMRKRSLMQQTIRNFFAERGVMEVETPLLGRAGVTDPYLANATTCLRGPGLPQATEFCLQTSPEYAMKRLLASGSGCIFQITKVVRDDEIGRFHNPEFSLLEWYRVGFDDQQLMHEIDELLQCILQTENAERVSYQQVFMNNLGIDPLTDEGLQKLRSYLCVQGFKHIAADEKDTDVLLQLAMTHLIEPVIGQLRPCFIYNFPASQAALARLDNADPRVSKRFELYYKGIELANGFDELTDFKEQALRFEQDNIRRQQLGLPESVVDNRLLEALKHGLPACAGVALGLDRLLMLHTGVSHIDKVLAFPILRA